MKKVVYLVLALLLVGSALAIPELPKGRCDYIRHATEYRPERVFQGVWGRFSDGSMACFLPAKKKVIPQPVVVVKPKVILPPTPEPEPEPVCEIKEVCTTHKERVIERVCEYKHHRQECRWEWSWKDVKTCEDKEVCESDEEDE